MEAEFKEVTTKEQFIDNFRKARNKISEAVEGLSDIDLDKPVTGEFSSKDLLAHIIEWDWSAIYNSRLFLEGKDPDFSPDEDNDAFNEIAVSIWRNIPGSVVFEEFRQSTQAVLDYVDTLTEEDLFRDRGLRFEGAVVNPANFLGEFEHDIGHAREIAEFRKQNGL